jgi:hypothetical protein
MSATASSQPSSSAMLGKRDATASIDANNRRPTKTIVGCCASASQCQAALAELRKFIYSGNIPLIQLQLERDEKLVSLKGWLSKESSNEESEKALMLQLLEGVGLGDDMIE